MDSSLIYFCLLINHTQSSGIIGIPITKANDYITDISPFLSLHYLQAVYYKVYESDILSYSTENLVVGFVSPNMLEVI